MSTSGAGSRLEEALKNGPGRPRPTCQRLGCCANADRVPTLRVWPVGEPKLPAKSAEISFGALWCCEACAKAVSIEDVIDDDGWSQLVAMFKTRGKAEPDRASLELHWKMAKEMNNAGLKQ